MDIKIVGPRSCEYCGSSSTMKCGPDCDRPTLYFAKQRSPFQKLEHFTNEHDRSEGVLYGDSTKANIRGQVVSTNKEIFDYDVTNPCSTFSAFLRVT